MLPDSDMLDMMHSVMGFPLAHCERALVEVKNESAEAAMNWLFSNDGSPLLDKPIDRGEKSKAKTSVYKFSANYDLSSPPNYELFGVVVHRGPSTASGHYVVFLKKGEKWVLYNDSKVTICENPAPHLSQGYLYWYHKV